MTIRVIAGAFRGRKLATVPGPGTRPLLGQVREAVFNILGPDVEGAEVWDLFAGTGANGIEALSRGARRVVFVEKSNRALRVLRQNLSAVAAESEETGWRVVRAGAWDPPIVGPAGEGAAGLEVPPDLVFFDPPYRAVSEDPTKAVARTAALCARIAAGGCLVFHFPEGVLDEDDLAALGDVDLRVWGTSAVAFVRI